MDGGGDRIDMLYTSRGNPRCELQKPRVLLGARVFRWMHWRPDLKRYAPCLCDFGQECRPCGTQVEFAFLAAAILEEQPGKPKDVTRDRVSVASFEDLVGKAPVLSLSEEERLRRLRQERQQTQVAPSKLYTVGRSVLQCVPAMAMSSMPDALRGIVIQIGHEPRTNNVRLTRRNIVIDPPEDFDADHYFRQRYGIRVERQPEVEQAILPFRRKAQ
jgi:hypothetical protein